MRVKTIISLIAFTLTFTFSAAIATLFMPSNQRAVALMSYDRSTADSISRFIRQDVDNGEKRNGREYDAINNYNPSMSSPIISLRAKAVSDYAEESGSMDESNLPQDFQVAWLKHMRAWHNYSDFLQKAKGTMSRCEVNRLEEKYNYEINATWYEVLRIGRRYGAEIPRNAY